MDKKSQDTIIEVLKEYGESEGIDSFNKPTADTVIFGDNASLDSLGLVNVVADIESRIEETFGRQITLADERAMSRRRSPFRTVESLGEYIDELLAEEGVE